MTLAPALADHATKSNLMVSLPRFTGDQGAMCADVVFRPGVYGAQALGGYAVSVVQFFISNDGGAT